MTKFIPPWDLLDHFSYTEQEKKEIRERLIKLDSIGHVLDPQSGFVFPVFQDGKLDYDNFLCREEIEKGNGISEKDWKILQDNGSRN